MTTLELIDRLSRAYRDDGDQPIKKHCSLQQVEELADRQHRRISFVLGQLRRQVDIITVSYAPRLMKPPVPSDGVNAFHIFHTPAGKAQSRLIGRSTVGAGSADVLAYLRKAYPDCLVELQ